MTKFCKDCKWGVCRGIFSQKWYCEHPSKIDLVTGNAVRWCQFERDYPATGDECGREGRNFELK